MCKWGMNKMELKDVLRVNYSKDKLKAWIELLDSSFFDEVTEEDVGFLIEKAKINFGLVEWQQSDWKQILANHQPLIIAKGIPPENGEDGYLEWKITLNSSVSEEEKFSFRDVTKIPSVNKGDKIATIVPATEGKEGTDVFGNPIRQKKGVGVRTKAGKNVEIEEETNVFVATAEGQLSITTKFIHVFPLYELSGDLSLETGNIDFVGSVTIRGNVGTGYSVKAKGDLFISGLVEGAFLQAGGNIVINEGISGMDKAYIKAEGNIETNYINQAKIETGNNLVVKKSILHSDCVAEGDIICQNGSIIGGSNSAGRQIEVKNVGNFAFTKTELALGINKKVSEQVEQLNEQLSALKDNQNKLVLLGNQLQKKKKQSGLNTKERIVLLKQRHSLEKVTKDIEQIQLEMTELQWTIGNFTEMSINVYGKAFGNVELNIGKYSRLLKDEHSRFKSYLKDMEIVMEPL